MSLDILIRLHSINKRTTSKLSRASNDSFSDRQSESLEAAHGIPEEVRLAGSRRQVGDDHVGLIRNWTKSSESADCAGEQELADLVPIYLLVWLMHRVR